MKISKDKIKRAAIVGGLSAALSEYAAASIIPDFHLIKNYQFQEFIDAINYNFAHPLSSFSNAISMDQFLQAQPFLIGGSLYLIYKTLFDKVKKYEDASEYGAYGTSRWSKDHEIFNKDNITSDWKQQGTILGMHKNKPIIQRNESSLNRNAAIVGGSGAGKTQSIIIPNILHTKDKSIVVIDPKGELYEQTSQIKRDQGYEVHMINFKNRDISDRYNLFDYIRRDSDSFKIADILVNSAAQGSKVKKDFWNQAQASVLQALILYVKHTLPHDQQHMGSVMNLAQSSEQTLKELFEAYPDNHIVKRAYSTAMSKLKDKTASDVFSTLNQTLNPWLYEDVCSFTAANDFLFEDLGKKKMILYVIMPIADNEFLPLITTFFSQLFSELYRLADFNYGKLPMKVRLELDEFANVGKIDQFEKRIATTRSLGIELSIILQDTSQLENLYGKEIAKEILNNCDIKLLLKASEYESAKYFSQLAGKTTIKITNSSRSSSSKSSSKNESSSYTGRDLITPDEINKLDNNNALLFLSGEHPMKIEKAWAFKLKQFTSQMIQEVSRDSYPVPDRGEYQAFYPEMNEELPLEPDPLLEMPYEISPEYPEGWYTDYLKQERYIVFKEEDGIPIILLDKETGESIDEQSKAEEDPAEDKDELDDLMDSFRI